MPVEFRNEQLRVRIDARRLRHQAESLLAAVGRADSVLSILVTDDRRIAPLHERWMGEPGPTDVMSFPMEEGRILGDIVIFNTIDYWTGKSTLNDPGPFPGFSSKD